MCWLGESLVRAAGRGTMQGVASTVPMAWEALQDRTQALQQHARAIMY